MADKVAFRLRRRAAVQGTPSVSPFFSQRGKPARKEGLEFARRFFIEDPSLPAADPFGTRRSILGEFLAQNVVGPGIAAGPTLIARGVGERVLGQATGEVARRIGTRVAPVVARVGQAIRGKPAPPITPASPAAQKLVKALKEAKPVRAEQEALFSAERSRRLAKMQAAGEGISGEAGARRMMGALKGELPKAQFQPVRPQFAQAEVDELFDTIKSSPLLPGYSKANAFSGLKKLLDPNGIGVPQEGELKLLTRVFGADFVRAAQRGRGIIPTLIEAAGIPRAIAATLDLSAPLRQGLVAGVRYPKQFVRAFGDMFRSAAREEGFAALKESIVRRPTFRLMEESGLALTGIDEGIVLAREEAFISRLPERIPVFGRLVRGSNRGYTAFLTKLRADVFDELLNRATGAGVQRTDELLVGISRFVNTATGRGDLGSLSLAGNALGTALFSPRLLAARINMLNPLYYQSLPLFVRKEAMKSMLSLASAGATVLGLASMIPGVTVGRDPRSADFGKIKIGNTRVDIWGGFQQYPRIAAQLTTGKLISSTTGREITLGEGFRPLTRKDIAFRFFESKANPLVGTILELMEGRTFEGERPTFSSTAKKLLAPMITQDLYELAREDPELLPLLGLGFFGASVQTYGPRSTNVFTLRRR